MGIGARGSEDLHMVHARVSMSSTRVHHMQHAPARARARTHTHHTHTQTHINRNSRDRLCLDGNDVFIISCFEAWEQVKAMETLLHVMHNPGAGVKGNISEILMVCVCVCVCVCVRARACMHACVHVCVRQYVLCKC